MTKLSMAEQETILRFDRESEELALFTHSRSVKDKLVAKGAKLGKASRIDGHEVAWMLTMPKAWFRMPRPRKKYVRKEAQDRILGQNLPSGEHSEQEAVPKWHQRLRGAQKAV